MPCNREKLRVVADIAFYFSLLLLMFSVIVSAHGFMSSLNLQQDRIATEYNSNPEYGECYTEDNVPVCKNYLYILDWNTGYTLATIYPMGSGD